MTLKVSEWSREQDRAALEREREDRELEQRERDKGSRPKIDWTACGACAGTGIVPELRGTARPYCARCEAGERARTRYRVEVIADNSGNWVGNGLLFADRAAAEAYGVDLTMRWTAVREYRVVPVDLYD